MRQFITDASHELRTLLTIIRASRAVPTRPPATWACRLSRLRAAEPDGAVGGRFAAVARLDAHRPLELCRVDSMALASDAAHDARAMDL